MTITNKKQQNIANYLILPFIEGVNVPIIGDSLINTFVSNKNDNIYIVTNRKSRLLESQEGFINSFIINTESLCYIFECPIQWKKELRKFKDNDVESYSLQTKEYLHSNMGLSQPTAKSRKHVDIAYYLTRAGIQGGIVNIVFYALSKINDLYDSLYDCPMFNPNNDLGITTFEDAYNFRVIATRDQDPLWRTVFYPHVKLVDISSNEYIENFIENNPQ